MRKSPFRVHQLLDGDDEIGLIRYDGDPDVFTALAWAHCINHEIDSSIMPPTPRLYRCNPDFTGEYGWLLGMPSKPGPGAFLGATIRTARYFEPAWLRELRLTNCRPSSSEGGE
ncbi:hypothetical protein Q0Z83_060560 [Actinoplanes sichuanensis]|uniref:Uncharacterized protein n=1 Tax=Actinoplanes sichuanensis TaxID=512349 RepID=A0ABW4A7M2_9ACTN|nr:hypothetical protein [Actinoplanes sichuanensis]BEL07865.1 hypothetical protein Q0Z83_060560 [Actinoplanes sichuanensis]